MFDCRCTAQHARRRIVLTGGPGAGKTAVLEMVRQYFCHHVDVLPEAASILFTGGFRRGDALLARAATQRAVFHVQRELEEIAEVDGNRAIVLCDRGTVDGLAYWPGPDDFFKSVGTTREHELARYHAVIHLRVPSGQAYNLRNPAGIESQQQAAAIDARVESAWAGHPRRFIIENTRGFIEKAGAAIAVLEAELPACCRPRP